MRTSEFDYDLPEELIAQSPTEERDRSRLLVMDRSRETLAHRQFSQVIEYLRPGDALVLNDTRVIPARLRGRKVGSNGRIELFLLEQNAPLDWWALARPGKRLRPGNTVRLDDTEGNRTDITATIVNKESESGRYRIRFSGTHSLFEILPQLGEIPLPPYIQRAARPIEDGRRYQTVYSRVSGSVAAPTAGLHFTAPLLKSIAAAGIRIGYLTLHVGYGTFSPVQTERVEDHPIHCEWYDISHETASLITDVRQSGGRIVAVGTTTVRVLEAIASTHRGKLVASSGYTNHFIYPPYRFQIVDALITNFHLPRSSLLLLVSAFASPGETSGRDRILAAYREAIDQRYRFYSYGDAMLII